MNYKNCISIKNKEESHLQCILPAKKGNYCIFHSQLKNNVDFTNPEISINEIVIDTEDKVKDRKIYHLKNTNSQRNLDIIISDDYIENTKIRLYILKNCLSSSSLIEIQKLLGDAFNSIADANNSIDPFSYDILWQEKDGKKVACIDNYLIFSYYTDKKLRCITVYTLYELYKMNHFSCLFTQKSLPDSDIERIKKLIGIYINHGFFPPLQEKKLELKDLLNNFLNKLHNMHIFIEPEWILKVKSQNILIEIIGFFTYHLINVRQIDRSVLSILLSANKYEKEDDLLKRIINFWDMIISNKETSYLSNIFVRVFSMFVPEIKKHYQDIF